MFFNGFEYLMKNCLNYAYLKYIIAKRYNNKNLEKFREGNLIEEYTRDRSIYISQEYVNIKWFPSRIIDFHIVKVSHVQEREPRGKQW